jgi:uncharacterized protein (DUF952 family)
VNCIYKVVSETVWSEAVQRGEFAGSQIDLSDGYIHFSTADQVVETVRKHFTGQDGLLLVTVDADKLGSALKWETSRGGALFPHLYGSLPLSAVVQSQSLPLGSDAQHQFPAGFAGSK